MEPILREIKEGWAAIGDYWAVFGATQEEAIRKFREAEERHKVIASREKPVIGNGIPNLTIR